MNAKRYKMRRFARRHMESLSERVRRLDPEKPNRRSKRDEVR